MGNRIAVTDWLRLRRIGGYLLRHKLIFAGGVCVTILFGLVETAVPWLMYLLLDAEQVADYISPEQMVVVLPALLVLLFVLRSLFGFARIYWSTWMQATMAREIRSDMIRRLLRLPRSYHDSESSGILVSRVMQFVDTMINNATYVLVNLLQDIARLAGYLATMFVVEWRYTLLVIIVMPLTMQVIRYFARRLRWHAGEHAQALSELTGALQDTVQGHSVVVSYGGQQREQDKLEQRLAKARGISLRQGVASALNMSLSQLLLALALALIFGLLARDLHLGALSAGEVSTFIFAMVLLPLPLRNLTRLAETIQLSLAASTRVFELIDAEPEANTGSFAPVKVRGDLRFDKVSFAYSSNPHHEVLDKLDLTVAAGEIVALVGPSGAGKTTVVNLLMRMQEPSSGVISIDGEALEHWDLTALRCGIGMVSQQIILFDTTLAENVAYPDVGDKLDVVRLRQALANAQLAQMVSSLPDGEQTMLGENGLRLSGGERQRLAIARALYKDAPIMVFDEATSSLDMQTEEGIKEALRKLFKHRTVIVIAHRFTTVEIVDRIAVLEHGRIVSEGSHSELMTSSQLYRELYNAQRLKG